MSIKKYLLTSVSAALVAVHTQSFAELVSVGDEELDDIVGQGFNLTHRSVDTPQFSGGLKRGEGADPAFGTWQNFQEVHADNDLNWEFYRLDVDMVMKVGMSIDNIKLGGYHKELDREAPGGNGQRNFDNSWDIEASDIQLGFVNPPHGTQHPTDESNDPFTIINPFLEVAFAPQCELYGGACVGENAESVFAGIRVGAEQAAGNAALKVKKVSGFLQANVNQPLGVPLSINNVGVWGQRVDEVTSFQGIPILGNVKAGDVLQSVQVGDWNGTEFAPMESLWISQVRNSFTWPEQNSTTVNDRDYTGFNLHGNGNVQAHGSLLGISL